MPFIYGCDMQILAIYQVAKLLNLTIYKEEVGINTADLLQFTVESCFC